ncbi:hypothetical protein K435DRAFT_786588 [Dendrothele bispora CBS 962.96]|uniref:Uncharacterized protein n=1 Tax=Dendrothele bispora (strain CBS 962.96) TaxID=1314807 RepID=A0A4S8KPT0_DENBC|nr:hypothetical protein K435DRAFT_786588 [Dendrothele bispora CBS 962.96]
MPVVPASPLGLIAKVMDALIAWLNSGEGVLGYEGYEGVQGMNMWDMGGIGVEHVSYDGMDSRVNGVGQNVRVEGLEIGYMPVHSRYM